MLHCLEASIASQRWSRKDLRRDAFFTERAAGEKRYLSFNVICGSCGTYCDDHLQVLDRDSLYKPLSDCGRAANSDIAALACRLFRMFTLAVIYIEFIEKSV